MRVVLDTNVLISGVFFSGPPYRILNAWREGRVELVFSAPILDEYIRVFEDLARRFEVLQPRSPLALLVSGGTMVETEPLAQPIVTDPDDDKFFACAIAGGCRVIVSGDRALRKASGEQDIQVLTPRQFVDRYL